MEFIIMKSTRARDDLTVTERNAYSNLDTCRKASVAPGKVYNNKETAEADTIKLGLVNPVGFVVVRLA